MQHRKVYTFKHKISTIQISMISTYNYKSSSIDYCKLLSIYSRSTITITYIIVPNITNIFIYYTLHYYGNIVITTTVITMMFEQVYPKKNTFNTLDTYLSYSNTYNINEKYIINILTISTVYNSLHLT